MQLSTDFIPEVLQMSTVGEALTLLKTFAIENKTLEPTIKKVTYGINIPIHYKKWEQKMFTMKEKKNTIIIDGKEYILETVWDEIDERLALAKEAIINEMNTPSKYKSRK